MAGQNEKQSKKAVIISISVVAIVILTLTVFYFTLLKTESSDILRRPLEDQPLKQVGHTNSKTELTAGMTFHVVRVKKDDILNIRRLPDPRSEIIGIIPPDGKGIYYLGNKVSVQGKSRYFDWYRIRFDNITGWVNSHFLEAD